MFNLANLYNVRQGWSSFLLHDQYCLVDNKIPTRLYIWKATSRISVFNSIYSIIYQVSPGCREFYKITGSEKIDQFI